MSRTPTQRLIGTAGEKVNLAGRLVAQIRFTVGGAAVRFMLSGENEPLCDLALAEVLTLTRDHDQLELMGARPGSSHNPRELAPLLDLLGERIEHVRLQPGGELTLTFSNDWTLAVGVTEFGESGWQLRHGKPVTLI